MNKFKNFCSELLSELKKENKNSFLAWISGTACDYLNGNPPNDYDITVFGVEFEHLIKIVDEISGVTNYSKEFLVINTRIENKRVDIYLSTIFKYQKNNWYCDHEFYKWLLSKKEVDPKKVISLKLESGVGRFTNRSIDILFPSMEIISNEAWLRDFKNKVCRHIRSESKYVFYDYMRLFRFSSMGYEIHSETRELMIDRNQIDYLIWADKHYEEDKVSEYQDSFLKYVLKVYDQKQRGLESHPDRFFNLCVETGLFESLFDQTTSAVNGDEEIKSPESFLLNIFNQDKRLLEDSIGKHFIYQNCYNLT